MARAVRATKSASNCAWSEVRSRAHYAFPVAFSDEKYVLFTTYRRDGTPVSTPVWVVELDADTLGFYTSSASGKAKRLAHTSQVTVQPCNARGVPKKGTSAQAATARVVDGAEYDQIHAKVVAKYGLMTKFTKFLGAVGGTLKGKRIPYGDRGVVVSLAS
jgi:PPOX class probable F420-dependent enzyme